MYSLTPYMLLWTGATLFNLSLLTSDAYAIIAGIFFFSYVVRRRPASSSSSSCVSCRAPSHVAFVDLCVFLVGAQPTFLYFVSLGAIVAGLVLYNVRLSSTTTDAGASAVLDDDGEAEAAAREPTEMDDVVPSPPSPSAYAQLSQTSPPAATT
jgi:hypothetical protein